MRDKEAPSRETHGGVSIEQEEPFEEVQKDQDTGGRRLDNTPVAVRHGPGVGALTRNPGASQGCGAHFCSAGKYPEAMRAVTHCKRDQQAEGDLIRQRGLEVKTRVERQSEEDE